MYMYFLYYLLLNVINFMSCIGFSFIHLYRDLQKYNDKNAVKYSFTLSLLKNFKLSTSKTTTQNINEREALTLSGKLH